MKAPVHWPLLLCSFLVSAAANTALSGEAVNLPTQIVLTKGDLNEFRDQGTLRGRPMARGTSSTAVWDGLQVFTGSKADVIRWLKSGQEGLGEIRGARSGWLSPQVVLYDLLVSALIQTDDIDIIRAVVWHVDRKRVRTDYARRDWERLVGDRRLTVPERIIVWDRVRTNPAGGTTPNNKEFWRLFGGEITPECLLDIQAGGRTVPWHSFYRGGSGDPPPPAAREVLLPLLRREYLSIDGGEFMRRILNCISSLYSHDDMTFRRLLVSKLTEWDALGDKRSAVLWGPVDFPDGWDDTFSEMVRGLVGTLTLPENASTALKWYASSRAGRTALDRDVAVWQTLVRDYLNSGFAKKDEYEQMAFLRLLPGTAVTRDGTTRLQKSETFECILAALRKHNAYVFVTPAENKLLRKAWRDFPEALERVKVKGAAPKPE